MPIDTDRLVQIANELKSLDQERQKLLAELARIAGGVSADVPAAPRLRRPPLSWTPAAAPRRGRPPGSKNRRKAVAPAPGRKRRKGLTTDLLEFLTSSGGAHTAGEIVAALRRPKTKSGVSTVSTTLVRLAKEGRVKKDKERGYRAA